MKSLIYNYEPDYREDYILRENTLIFNDELTYLIHLFHSMKI